LKASAFWNFWGVIGVNQVQAQDLLHPNIANIGEMASDLLTKHSAATENKDLHKIKLL
jgi:hypothetical protein